MSGRNLRREADLIREILRRSGVDHATISTQEGYVRPLMQLLKQREVR